MNRVLFLLLANMLMPARAAVIPPELPQTEYAASVVAEEPLEADEESAEDRLRIAEAIHLLDPVFDVSTAATRLAQAIRFRTVSREGGDVDSLAFRAFHAFLERAYPAAHTAMTREKVNGLSLLYTWPGRDTSLAPILLMAHQDVVPVEEESERDWTHPPFAGAIDRGYVWGRGTIDNKQGVVGIMEAVEQLVGAGFVPERTVYLAFGHDEEVGGHHGAARIAALLRNRGVRLFMVLDEGGFVVKRFLSRVRGSVAAIGVAEKGSVSLELTTHTDGGHSAVPGGESALDILTRAKSRLDRKPFPRRLHHVPALTLKHLARALPLPERVVLSNLWLFKPLVLARLGGSPETGWMLRTTTAVTMFNSGTKSNVLPTSASAVVNFRTMPGETLESVTDYVRKTIRDDRVEIRPHGTPREAAPFSGIDGAAYQVLTHTIREIVPGERLTIVPFLVPGGTDARHFVDLTDSVYRFSASRMSRHDLKRFHATDERIAIAEYGRAVKFYYRLIVNAAGG